MAKSPYQSAYEDWSKRVAKYQQAGIPETVYAPIANRDLQRVYSQGSSVMTNEQADTAVYAAAKGYNPIAETPRHHGGLFGALESVVSNIVPDIGNIITSLPRGLYDLGKDVVTPSQWQKTGQDLVSALHDFPSDPGKSFRDVAQSPFLDLIPGVADVANLTTPQGRTSLEEHPVTAALDVLPITKPLSAASGAMLAGKTAEHLSPELTEALTNAGGLAKLRGRVDVRSSDPSATAALVAGRPVQAGMRALDRTVGAKALGKTETGIRAASEGVGPGQLLVRQALSKTNLSALSQEALKQVTREGQVRDQATQVAVKNFMDSVVRPLGDVKAVQDFMQKAQMGDVLAMNDAEKVAYDKWKSVQNFELNPRMELYHSQYGIHSPDAVIVKHMDAREKAAARVAQIAEARSIMQETGARTGKIKTAKGKTINASLETMAREYKKAKADLKSRDRKVETALVRISGSGLPAHLHPQMKAMMQKHLRNALEKQRTSKGAALEDVIEPTEKISAGRIVQTYADAMKELDNPDAGTFAKFREYVGKKETKALFVDSAHELLRMSYDGLSPLFFHEPKSTIASRAINTHLAATRDIAEAQTRKKLWNMHETTLSPQFGMSEQMGEIERRDGMQQSFDKAFAPHLLSRDQLIDKHGYREAAARLKDPKNPKHLKFEHISEAELTDQLMLKDNVVMDFARFGIKRTGGRGTTEVYLPRELASVLENLAGDTNWSALSRMKGYNKVMRVFRTSVLYGPRHFAHVVIGGMMPLMLSEPRAILEFPQLMRPIWNMTKGKDFNPLMLNGKEIELPGVIGAKFDYSTDAGYKMLQQKAGSQMGRWLQDHWEKTGKRVGDGTQQIEDFAQSLYQGAAYMRALKRAGKGGRQLTGDDEMAALEHARDMVVNLDKLTPFERTIMKQVFPFYSFTRFAVTYLTKLPFDHPLRVAILSQLSNQALEEWGTGLPQTMMSLLFFGSPNDKGNVETMNLRNANPFRSVSNMFTLGGFMESLNPILQAPFIAAGYNPLSGSSQMYPDIVFNAATGTLVAARPKGDWMLAAEQFMPELGGLDYALGISSNLRQLRSTDPGAFDREMLNMFNIPFAISQYNIPQERGKVAENALKGAQNALSQYRKTGNYDDTIGRFALIPYNGQLITPQAFKQWWEQQSNAVHTTYGPNADPAALIAKPQALTSNTLQQLVNYYGG